jgi:hypothetical protein
MQQSSNELRTVRLYARKNGQRVRGVAILPGLCLIAAVLLLVPAAPARADALPLDFTHSASEIQQAEEEGHPQTDPQAATELPHADLGRSEAEDLIESVFGPMLEAPAGIFNDLKVERFLSDTAAVIAPGDAPEALGDGESAAPMLLESSIPLRTEAFPGGDQEVDLGLEHSEGQLQPSNPLVEVGLPSELGEGIELANAGVQVELEGAPENRTPSVIGQSVAFYPNVAEDTDLAVSPTPTGVETFTQFRTPQAPTSQTFNLSLPAGTILEATDQGGAEATLDGDLLLKVLPPTASDASGEAVPVQLDVSGDSVTVTATPDVSAQYPIVVDPVIEDLYHWESGLEGWQGWSPYRTPPSQIGNVYNQPEHGCSTYCYLAVFGNAFGWNYLNSQSYWNYTVPRFQEDYEAVGTRPTSWVQCFTAGNMVFSGNGDFQTSPGAIFAISNQSGAWDTANIYPPNQTGTYGRCTPNQTGKMASFGLFATGNTTLSLGRYVLVGYSQILLGDEDKPSFSLVGSPAHWVNSQAETFNVSVGDLGLGVASLQVATSGGTVIGTTQVKNGASNCTGTTRATCPRNWQGAQAGNLVAYNPTTLPQGTNNLKLTASDPVGNKSEAQTLQIKVDHTAPNLTLTGSVTEQGTLGRTLPQYILKAEAKDGTTASPQSGIAKTEVKVDGKVVSIDSSWAPGCATQNCALTKELILKAAEYSVGKHTIEVTTVDAVGLKSAMKTVQFEFQPDGSVPALALSGALKEAPNGWVNQQTYSLPITATDVGGYGVKQIQLKIDGALVSQSEATACAAGGCARSKTFSVNTNNYDGGAHAAEVVATDWAGNAGTSKWTMNVNPKGAVNAQEAADTLEAVDETLGSEIVAPPSAGEGLAEGESGEIRSEGTDVETVLDAPSGSDAIINAPEGAMEMEGPNTVGIGEPQIIEGVSAVSGGSGSVDFASRPIFDGFMQFQQIRAADAPESYSWTVELDPGQTLALVSSEMAQVYYADGTPAMAIRPEPAHDVAGHVVPTTLAVEGGDGIVLTVHHRNNGFSYPVTAGAYFATGYQSTVITEPTFEGPPEVYWVTGDLIVGAPESIPSSEASISTVGGDSTGDGTRRMFVRTICGHASFYPREVGDGNTQACGNPFTNDPGHSVVWQAAMRGAFLYKPRHWAEQRGARDCDQRAYQNSVLLLWYIYPDTQCHYGPKTNDGNGGNYVKADHYLRAQAHWPIAHRAHCGDDCPSPNPYIFDEVALELHLYPSGDIEWAVP